MPPDVVGVVVKLAVPDCAKLLAEYPNVAPSKALIVIELFTVIGQLPFVV